MRDRFLRETMIVLVSMVLILFYSAGYAENVDPNNDGSQYAYGENIGWLNAEPLGDGGPGVEVGDFELTGYIWCENIGWISLSCENTNSCASVDYGVLNDGSGNLSGYAWGENVGWINFAPAGGGVTIDDEGNFDGWAWGENIGWIHFQNLSIPYKIQTTWIPLVNETSICSTLGNDPHPSILDQDIFEFEGTADEEVTIRLEVDEQGSNNGGERATLILMDEIRRVWFFRIDRSALVNEITATLPADGGYLIIVAEQPWFFRGKRFRGDYCLTLESSEDASQTLEATYWVE
jgi:hypothetical protein